MTKGKLVELLKKEMVLALGCTEPAASALAGAKARDILGLPVKKAVVYASRDMVKNAMGVGLPSCELKGIQAAVALGICGGDCSNNLGILSTITEEQKKEARKLHTKLELVKTVPPLYVGVKVINGKESAEAFISGKHDRFIKLIKNGETILDLPFEEPEQKDEVSVCREEIANLTLKEIYDIACTIEPEEVPFIFNAIKVNKEIAEYSMKMNCGLCVGKEMLEDIPLPPKTLSDAFRYGSALAAGGSDARMSGCTMPVIINSGSGNQGITVTVPVAILADYLKKDEKTLSRAVFISEMVGLILTARKDRLSALCGAFTAAIGTSCAYVYLLGGDNEIMDRAVNTMVGNLTGIICDGAKSTCALKLFSCLEAAALSARLAIKGFGPGSESGIVGKNSLESIDFLCKISHEGMEMTDKTILSIMLNKKV